MLNSTGTGLLMAAMLAAAPLTALAQERIVLQGAGEYDNGVVPARVHVDMTRLPEPRAWKPGMPIKEIPQRKGVPKDYVPPVTAVQPAGGDPLRDYGQRFPARDAGRAFGTPTVNRNGTGFTGVNPPDTVGDVGNDYFVQMVNGGSAVGGTRVLVLDKDDGITFASFALSELAVGTQTNCTAGSGDPIVMFDSTVDNGIGEPSGRWFLTEFTSVSFCVYISETADPTAGNWVLYEFASDSGGLPDYPKFAVWPDAYYIGANENGPTEEDAGRTVYALDRENMLAGLPTRPTQVFEIPLLEGFGFQMAQPADWDGATPPPADAPGLFLRHRDDEVHNSGSADPDQDFLEIWEFSVDWADSNNSTFSGPTNIGVAEFESELCGLTAFACVPQPDTFTQLDPLREPVMWRAQYRNFGKHQMIVGSWVTDVVGGTADIHGVRWTELRDAGAGWALHQQGTVSPDNVNRWMPSIAMDGSGNIAVGYNVADSAVFPGLRYTGRLESDALDTMPINEVRLVDGSGSNASNRYGDYSSLTVDPIDECTFWFTGEYNAASQWSTRIGKFRFDACGTPDFLLDGAPRNFEACVAGGDQVLPDVDLTIGSFGGFAETVSLQFTPPLADGFSGFITPDEVTPAEDPPAGSIASISVLDGAAAGDYSLIVSATAAGVDPQALAVNVSVADVIPSAVVLDAPGDGAGGVALAPVFTWLAGTQADTYVLEVATDPAFSNVIIDEVVGGTSFQPVFALNSQTEYFWRVTPANQCGAGAPATASFTTAAAPGECAIEAVEARYFFDDVESGDNGWTHIAADPPDTWARQTDDSSSPVTAWRADSVPETSDQQLISPMVSLPADANLPTLQYLSKRDLEPSSTGCFDGAVLEYSDNGGQTWILVDGDNLQTNPYTGPVNQASNNPLAGRDAWCGKQDWTRTVVDLRGLEGRDLQFRFRLGTDFSIAQNDWLIDDVLVQSCQLDGIFADGFESTSPL